MNADKPLEPVFFAGMSGLGKTMIAYWLEEQIKTRLKTKQCHTRIITGIDLRGSDDVYEFAADMYDEKHKICVVEEAHTIQKRIAGIFCFMMDCNLNHKPIMGEIHKPCVFIFCSEFEEKLQQSLRSRFVHSYKLVPYSHDELIQIIDYHLPKLKEEYCFKGEIHRDAVEFIALRSRQNARYCVNNIKRCLKEAQQTNLDLEIVRENFRRNIVGEFGLNRHEMVILYHLFIKTTRGQGGKPISIMRLADQLSMNKDQISVMYEPFLNSCGFIEINSKGRTLSRNGEGFVISNKEELDKIYDAWRAGKL